MEIKEQMEIFIAQMQEDTIQLEQMLSVPAEFRQELYGVFMSDENLKLALQNNADRENEVRNLLSCCMDEEKLTFAERMEIIERFYYARKNIKHVLRLDSKDIKTA